MHSWLRKSFHYILLAGLGLAVGTLGIAAEGQAQTATVGTSDKPESLRILYVTNRQKEGNYTGKAIFGGERGNVSFGECIAEFSPIPFASDLAANLPFYLKEEFKSISRVEQMDAVQFWNDLEESAKSVASRSVVLYVHGYNYGFERSCDMAAEIQRSLDGVATVVAFSWPSNGLASDYMSDLADVEWSTLLLAEIIGEIHARLGADRIKVAAHSIGSRGAIFSLVRLALKPVDQPVIDHLVLLAPDFDSQTFVDLLPTIRPLAGHVTLYASDKDTPLKFSRQLNGYPRLGEAGEHLTVVEGMDTIDVSTSGRHQITGHEYFFYNHLVVADLVALLGTGEPASGRPGLEAREFEGLTYWQVK